ALADGKKGIDKYVDSLRDLYSYWNKFSYFENMRSMFTTKSWVEPKEFGLSHVDSLRKEVADAEAVYRDLENKYMSWANDVFEKFMISDTLTDSFKEAIDIIKNYYDILDGELKINEGYVKKFYPDEAEGQKAIDQMRELIPLLEAVMKVNSGDSLNGFMALFSLVTDPEFINSSIFSSNWSENFSEALQVIYDAVGIDILGDGRNEFLAFLKSVQEQAEKVERLRAELYATEQAYEAFNNIINSGEQYFDNQTAAVLDLVLALKKAQTEWGILQAQYSMYMDRNLLGETLQKDKMDEFLQGAFDISIPTTTVSALDATNAMINEVLSAMTSNVNTLKDALSFVFEEADTELQDILNNIGENMAEKFKAGDYAFDLTDLIAETDNTKLNELMDNLSAKLEARAAALKAQESLSEGEQQHLDDLEKMITAIGSGDLFTAISIALKNFIEQREIYDDLVESQAELTDDTLKYNTLLKDIVDSTTALNSLYNQWKDKQEAITYDTLVMSGILRDLSLQPILFTDKRDTQDVLSDIKDIENAYRREGEQLANLLETERKWKDAHDKATAANDTDKLNELDKLRNKLYAGIDSADYKEALAEISKVIGLTDEELKQLTADISQQRIVLTDLSNEWDNLSEEYKSLVMMDNWADVMSESMSRLQPMINETVSSVEDLVKASKDLIAEQNGLKWSNTLRDYVEDAATLAKDITSRLTGSVPQSIASIFAKDVKSQYESQYDEAYKTLTELAAKHTKANEGLIEQTRVREQLPQEIANLKGQIDNIKYSIDQSKSLLDSKSSDISSKAEAQLKSMRTQLIELEAALKDANDQLANAQNATEEYNAEIANLEDNIANTTVQLSDLQAKYREIEQNEIFADKLSKSLDILIPKIKDVKDRIESLIKTYRNLTADYSGLVWSDIAQDYIVNMTAQAENAAKALVGIVSTSLEAAVIPESYIESLESRYSAEITELAKLESEYTKAYEDLLTTQLLREKLLEKQADLAKNVSTLEMNLFTAMADDRGSEDLAKVIDQYIKELDEINELSAEAKAEIDSIDQSIEHLSYTVLVDLAITIGVVKQRMSELIDIFANTNSVKEFTEFIAASFKNIAPTITKTSDEIKQAIKSTYDVIYKQMGMTWSDGFQKYVRDSADIIAEEVKAAMPEVASSVNEAL
ncbi:MAG: hypothetical protein PHF76_12130, partial [Bacteroidales bacterium]|nr:hypothetical protein [Bacteroidales bacterium]